MSDRIHWPAAISFAAVAALLGCGGGGGSDATPSPPEPDEPSASEEDLPIAFPRMYSGYDGVHEYRIPVKVIGLRNATFRASDPSMVTITKEGSGALITTRKAGEVTIIAELRGMRGSAKLTIAAYTPAQWEAGKHRYNHAEPYRAPVLDPCNPPTEFKLSPKLSCTNCHGVTGTLFSDIRHNPTQIGGYSDEELVDIFTKGRKPATAVDRGFIDLAFWSSFHQWEVSETERVGVIAYLRSLEPRELGSVWDFGGSPRQDAGEPPEEPPEPADPMVPVCDAGTSAGEDDGERRSN